MPHTLHTVPWPLAVADNGHNSNLFAAEKANYAAIPITPSSKPNFACSTKPYDKPATLWLLAQPWSVVEMPARPIPGPVKRVPANGLQVRLDPTEVTLEGIMAPKDYRPP